MHIEHQRRVLQDRRVLERRQELEQALKQGERRAALHHHMNNLKINDWMQRYHEAKKG